MMKKTLLALMMGTLACAAMAAGPAPTLEASATVVRDAAQGAQTNPLSVDDQLARRKPRVPGGSGCDDPEDLIEHPECSPNASTPEDQLARSKPRVPGGSGCDDPEDLIEHPECRPNTAPREEQQAREASEGPRGGDRAGEDNGGGRGGRGRG
jgi:hypothetical protein